MTNTLTGTHGRKREMYPRSSMDGYDSMPRGDGTFDLTIKPGVPTVTYYTSDERAPAWQLAVYSDEPDVLHLILGDMGYHDVLADQVVTALDRGELRDLAEVFDETGAVDDIFELFETYLELAAKPCR